jgi:hypothetical protein
MPATTTSGEQILEAAVAGPDGANRLFTVTGLANVPISVGGNQQKTETWTFLVGPTLTRPQFYRAIGTASVAFQDVTLLPDPSMSGAFLREFTININSVEADWDDESGKVEVRVEVFLSSNNSNVNIAQMRYWVTILAQI